MNDIKRAYEELSERLGQVFKPEDHPIGKSWDLSELPYKEI